MNLSPNFGFERKKEKFYEELSEEFPMKPAAQIKSFIYIKEKIEQNELSEDKTFLHPICIELQKRKEEKNVILM